MLVKRSVSRIAWLPATVGVMLSLAIALPSQAAGQGPAVAIIELVPVRAPQGAAHAQAVSHTGPGDTTTELAVPLDQVDLGESFVVEVWATSLDSQGLSSVSTTLRFDPTVAVVTAVVHTMLFSELTRGDVDNAVGLVTGLSGSHLSSCDDQVGVAPTWARVALVEMLAVGPGLLVVESAETGLPALGTAICGVGDLPPSQVAYGSATLTVNAPPIPTVSQWGLMALALMLLAAGTVAKSRARAR